MSKCEAKHEIKWESGHIRSMGPCSDIAEWVYDSPGYPGSPLTAEHLNVCGEFRRQVGVMLIEDPSDTAPFSFTSLREDDDAEVSGNTDPAKGE